MFDFMLDQFDADATPAPSGPVVPAIRDCLSCGACLSVCPTYLLTQDENEGPRQRIRTLSKIVVEEQAQTVDAKSIYHLTNCLQCRACEAVCPSQMSYSQLFDKVQHQLSQNRKKSILAILALNLIAKKKRFKRALSLVRFYYLSGICYVIQKIGVLKLLGVDIVEQMARIPTQHTLKDSYTPPGIVKGRVVLFTGCVTEDFDRETLDSAIKVLNRIGYEVVIPKQQVCCGAIHHHNGEPEMAKNLMQQNRACFNQIDADSIIYCATGCGCQLQEYDAVLELEENETAFQMPLNEVISFIAKHWDDTLWINPRVGKVLVHEACSQRNMLKNQQAIYELLAKIGKLQIEPLEENQICCGAGGSYMLTHQETAQALRDKKWQYIKNSAADCVVTANIGCLLHLQSYESQQHGIDFKHPVTLLARQLNSME